MCLQLSIMCRYECLRGIESSVIFTIQWLSTCFVFTPHPHELLHSCVTMHPMSPFLGRSYVLMSLGSFSLAHYTKLYTWSIYGYLMRFLPFLHLPLSFALSLLHITASELSSFPIPFFPMSLFFTSIQYPIQCLSVTHLCLYHRISPEW